MASLDHADELDLSGHWLAGRADEELRRVWYEDDFDDAEFDPIDVPGHWRRNTAFADNDDPLLYRRRFSALKPGQGTRAWLHFHGICTQGDIWLDGSYLGNTDGAWVPAAFDVTDALATRSDHTLGVEVASPPLDDPSAKRGLLGTWQDGPYVTRGWNPGGIWQPVRLRRTGPVAITAHRVLCVAATKARATLAFTCSFDSDTACEVTITTTVAGSRHERRQPLAKGANAVTWTVDIQDPALWWPYELGDQPLTDVTVAVAVVGPPAASDQPVVGDDTLADAAGTTRVSDVFSRRVGLRSVNLRDWILTVNGERLFLRGVRAGPAAHELGTAPADVFTDQVLSAKDAGCNLIRVHAHISRVELYDAADRSGMLVWQDLPLYRGQHRSVRGTAARTAVATIDRLGAHPSIALWCAHDEPDEALPVGDESRTGLLGRFAAHQLPNMGRSVLDRSLKRTLTANDPTRPTIGSSGTWPHPPTLSGTDTHLSFGWTDGAAEDLARLARAMPRAVRFVQITPSPSSTAEPGPDSLRNWPPASLQALIGDSPVDPDLLEHRLPMDAFDSAEHWQQATLNCQAQLIRVQVEALRRIKYTPTGGFIVAHLGDLSPMMSPSLIDENGVAKPAFAALKAANAPVLLTLTPWPGCTHAGEVVECEVHVVNDTRETLSDARLDVRTRFSDDGEPDDSFAWTFAGTVDADAVTHIGRIAVVIPDDGDRLHVELRLTTADLAHYAHYSVPIHVH